MVQNVFKLIVFSIPILAALPVSAQFEEPQELSASEMVRVVTRPARVADCLAPLAVNKIDGETAVVSAQEFLLEPGMHAINGRATLDFSRCPHDIGSLQFGSVEDLEAEFVTGFTYYLGFDYKSANPAEWKLVVWKMEQSEPLDVPEEATENQLQ